eukprot:COSAG02_NODE_4870_length_4880_cov_2.006902_3_plen_175_part_00
MSVFTQTQEKPSRTRKEWSPSAVMDIQINHLCRTLYFLVIRVGDPVFAQALREDPSVRLSLLITTSVRGLCRTRAKVHLIVLSDMWLLHMTCYSCKLCSSWNWTLIARLGSSFLIAFTSMVWRIRRNPSRRKLTVRTGRQHHRVNQYRSRWLRAQTCPALTFSMNSRGSTLSRL